MELQQRINAFSLLGQQLRDYVDANQGNHRETDEKLDLALERSSHANGWFKRESLLFALRQWGQLLTIDNLENWTDPYTFTKTPHYKTVGVVAAGNIPLVGFHDLLAVLISGSNLNMRQSRNDKFLLPALVSILESVEPAFKGRVKFTEDKLQDFDAVIATGSNNTARYFDYYFGRYPHIIRRNRNGVAVLDGTETSEQLEGLAEDIFRYFGLGCRNVSKLFVPENYNFDAFFQAMYSKRSVIDHHKYMNNYDYNKAVYLMSDIPLLDNEFMLLKQDEGYSSPIGVVFHESYQNQDQLANKLMEDKEHIQCVVSGLKLDGALDFGQAQQPGLDNYADGVDTVDFVLNTSR
ncbi:acyl-CoA reductase [Aureitalea marina]|uniref:Acyl-CoA reductase n=1 Tax=Aureitalea marina TaxID=930804 RepID=A0A2S7KPB3_9FLAO|nr:acyl-CoA reductase [Aureitalea marina]PQB04474.1 acyl-CoA reductase [Aureitalea marina]